MSTVRRTDGHRTAESSLELSDRRRFQEFREIFLSIVCLYSCISYTFKLLPQFKIGISQPDFMLHCINKHTATLSPSKIIESDNSMDALV